MNATHPTKGRLGSAGGRLSVPVTERDHTQGSETAAVTLVEYGDYECPHCGRAHLDVKELQLRFGAQMRFAFRNFPLRDLHPHAQRSAEAAEAAAAQGAFWEMHDTLFANQSRLDDGSLMHYAQSIGLDTTRWELDMREHVFARRVQEDYLSGLGSEVRGTPTFFIDGVRHDLSTDLDTLLMSIEGALSRRAILTELSR